MDLSIWWMGDEVCGEAMQQPENNTNHHNHHHHHHCHVLDVDDAAAAAAAVTAPPSPQASISDAVLCILRRIPGEDADRQGLVKTPGRCAQALLELTQGYSQDVGAIVNGALFDIETEQDEQQDGGEEDGGGLVVQRDIEIFSLCEHRMMPFYGKMHIAYMPGPGGRVLGLSKLARIADMFARRLQVQERLTRHVAEALEGVLGSSGEGGTGVAVVAECAHLCMAMCGVRKAGAVTLTESVRGVFAEDRERRREVLAVLVGAPRAGGGGL